MPERERHSSEAQTPDRETGALMQVGRSWLYSKVREKMESLVNALAHSHTKKKNVEGKESRERGETECRVMKNEHVVMRPASIAPS